jgi:thioesterase domain-containing protein
MQTLASACVTSDLIVPFNDDGNGLPLYFVHSIGGEVESFQALARLLAPEQRFYGVQAPEAKQNAAFASSIESMARRYVDALTAFQPVGPLMLGGWSAGSTIALEMAQLLTARGRTVKLLIALEGAPPNTNSGTSLFNPIYYGKLLINLPRWMADHLKGRGSFRALLRRVRAKMAALFKTALLRLRGQRESVREVASYIDVSLYSPDQVGFMNALSSALRAYVPKPYAGRVLLYKARTQPLHHLLKSSVRGRPLPLRSMSSWFARIMPTSWTSRMSTVSRRTCDDVYRHCAPRPNEHEGPLAAWHYVVPCRKWPLRLSLEPRPRAVNNR